VNSLLVPNSLASLVVAMALLLLGLLLVGVMPTRKQSLIARRITTLRPASIAGPSSRLTGRLDRVITALLQFSLRVLGPEGQQELRHIIGASAVARRVGLLTLVAGQLGLAALTGTIGWFMSARFAGESVILHWACVAVAVLLGAYLPDLVLRKMARHRLHEIEFGLPDALDLLVICAESGLSFESSLERVAAELQLTQPALASEFAATSNGLRVLPEREAALLALAERVPLKSMGTVVTTLIHTLRYGTPLAQSLRVMAATLRNEALLALEESAGKLPALMTIPMILFTLPATFLVLAGPAALRILDTFK
jgi:tight adherence protein C